ncbi:hypothetical protein Bca52824_072706 [Brassica carinata]|uniref:Uncharacterized protein n=1 Tax=Brassica carinata TaxID=52824 RepID=A0A8X7Q8X4_BRACI|nr:hypothetical protein Bca52824_072706 [Brassica carinata]
MRRSLSITTSSINLWTTMEADPRVEEEVEINKVQPIRTGSAHDQPDNVLALDGGHPTFTHCPTDKQVLWFRRFAQEFNWNSMRRSLSITTSAHKFMDNYGKQIHEWKKKWKSTRFNRSGNGISA